MTESGHEGIYNCYLDCISYPSWLDDTFCDPELSCAATGFDGGSCESCVMEDLTMGVVDCEGLCSLDLRGDGTCDERFDCAEHEDDGRDCASPGDPCTGGIFDCDLSCLDMSDHSLYSLGSGTCQTVWDCAYFGFDGGDCDLRGEDCVLDDGTAGVVDCSDTCAEPPSMDGICDERFACEPFDYDSRDCESAIPICEALEIGSGLGLVATGTLTGEDDSIHALCGSSDFGYMGGADTAFHWAAPEPGGYTFSIVGGESGSASAKTISLYQSDCESFMVCEAASGTGDSAIAQVTRYMGAFESVVIMVDGVYGWIEGEFDLEIQHLSHDVEAEPTPSAGCDAGKIYDCAGSCVDLIMVDYWLSDGSCDDGSWDLDFNCEEFDWDGGACDED